MADSARSAPGDIDPTFQPALDGTVQAIAVQDDQRILIGGAFTNVNGISRPYMSRLHPDGTLDQSFDAGSIPTAPVEAIAAQPDGRIVFSFGGRVVRVNAEGRREPTNSFPSPAPWYDAPFYIDQDGFQGPGWINTLVLAGNRILVGGAFNRYEWTNGTRTVRGHLARLNFDGRLDSLFVPQISSFAAPEIEVVSVLPQSDGKIIAAGWVSGSNGLTGILRFDSFGRIDQTFTHSSTNWFTNVSSGFTVIRGAALQADGRIIAFGDYSLIPANQSGFLIRLNADRSRDTTFQPSYFGSDWWWFLLGMQKNEKPLVSRYGSFTRYLPDGQIDVTFRPELNTSSVIDAIAFQRDSKIIVGGTFGNKFLLRLIGSADAQLSVTRTAEQNIRVLLRGESYQAYQVQRSSNLIDWSSATNLISTNGVSEFEDSGSPARRFYRALQTP